MFEFILNLFFPKSVKSFPKEKGKLFFTFDDGPNPEVTPEILKILDEFNAQATFFCLGENAEKYPELMKEVLEKGHGIGNHSYDHPNGFKTPVKKYITNIDRANISINSKLFRPPYGCLTPLQYFKLKKKYTIVFWNSIAHDWNNKLSPDECVRNVKKSAKDGSIIVMHDNLTAKNNVLNALPVLLEHYSKLGFTFEKIW